MKKFLLLVLLLILPFTVSAKEVNIDVFYGETCPYCHNELNYLDTLKRQLGDNINIKKYEVWNNKDNSKLMLDVQKRLNDDASGVPYTVIGDKTFVGYSEDIGREIHKEVISNLTCGDKTHEKSGNTLVLPLLGRTDVESKNTIFYSFILGALDVFNPCSIWIILILMAILIAIYNEKKRFKIGISFVCGYVLTYLIFIMTSLSLSIGNIYLSILRIIVSILVLVIGCLILDSFMRLKDEKESYLAKASNTFGKKQMGVFMIGTFASSLIISLVQISSSSSLPVIYEAILNINNVTGFAYGLNIFIYILSFLIVSLLILFIIVKFINLVIMNTSLKPYARLISGIMLLLLSGFLIFFPELLLFTV